MTKLESTVTLPVRRSALAQLAIVIAFGLSLANTTRVVAAEPMLVWPDKAPGETSLHRGDVLPSKNEPKPITRVANVRCPTIDVFPAQQPNGTGIIILPGGGFNYVVPDLEGSEAAPWLNKLGITVFVLRYRTKESAAADEPLWQRPLQDAQRAVRLVRSQADKWQLKTDRIGVLGFSAGGQVGSILHTHGNNAAYPLIDAVDQQPCRPDFSLLIYPWQILDSKTGELLSAIQVTKEVAPAFIVHTHDDGSTAVGAAKLYIALKQANVSAELHVYQNGGHGYGVRQRPDSVIHTWPDRAGEWLKLKGLAN